MEFKKKYIALIVLSFILFKCKDKKQNEDVEKPFITIIKPDNIKSYMENDTIYIRIKIADNIKIKDVQTNVFNTTNNKEVLGYNSPFNKGEGIIDTMFIIKESSHSTYKIEIIATDNSENKANKSIYIHANHNH